MTFLIDANLLVYAAVSTAPEHGRTRAWLQARFSDSEAVVGLSWSSLYAFVRLISNRRIMGDDAVDLTSAWDAAEAFRLQPNAVIVEPGAEHPRLAARLIATPGLSSNDVPDVFLAALAIERGLVLASRDHGFARFGGLQWVDPLE